jgi:CHAD domain-containing protein
MTELARGSLARSLVRSWRRYEDLRASCEREPRRGVVHDFRSEIRRLVAALDLLETLLPGCKPICKLRNSVKRELDLVRELRDLQVQEKRVKDESVLRALRRRIKTRRKKLVRSIPNALSSKKLMKNRQRFARIESMIGETRPNDRDLLLGEIAKSYRELERRATEAESADLSTVHRLRIALRKYRYACETIQALAPVDESSSDHADRFQKALGDLQDDVVLLGMLGKKERAFEPQLEDETRRLAVEIMNERKSAVRALRPRRRTSSSLRR